MSDLVSSSQSAFLKGRNITDAFVTARELLAWGSKSGVEGVGVKVDFEKAYDKIYWPFLFRCLQWWGFDEKWCNWIKLCVCNAKIAILINDDVTDWIKTKRGIRQGDPLSPYLFLLVAECLARLTNEAVRNNLITGIGPTEASRTTLIQFADDTFFFCKIKKRCLRNLKFIWQLFEWASGLRINREKSEIYYTGQTEGRACWIAQVLGCKVGSLPTKYLGLPLSTGLPSKEDWRGIICKIQNKIDGWQGKLLSRGGRLILVNAVLSNLPIYYLSVFLAPKWVIKRIEALRRDFFWTGGLHTRGIRCLVSWQSVCRNKKEGGLGILDINTMNQALLVKWWWKLQTSPHLQWNKLIHDLFYRRRRPLKEGSSFRPSSSWWKNVLKLKGIYKWGAFYRLGDGSTIDFWEDRWCGETTLRASFPEIFHLSPRKNLRINEGLSSDGWCWDMILTEDNYANHNAYSEILAFKDRISMFTSSEGQDSVLWRWSTDGQFTVKSTYLSLRDGGTRDTRLGSIWSLRIPLKVKVFCWLVLKKRLLTADNLVKKGWSGNTKCMLCGLEEETVDHLFSQCVISRYLIAYTQENFQLGDLGEDVRVVWDRWVGSNRTPATSTCRLTGLIAGWWITWDLRNSAIFRATLVDPILGAYKIKQLTDLWLNLLPN